MRLRSAKSSAEPMRCVPLSGFDSDPGHQTQMGQLGSFLFDRYREKGRPTFG